MNSGGAVAVSVSPGYLEISDPLAARGIPTIPLRPRTKIAVLDDWQTKATTDFIQMRDWDQRYPDANAGSVALAVLDGFWFLEIDKPEVIQRIESATGQKIPETFRVRSSPGRGHFYFKQSPASIAMGNIAQGYVLHGDWSARVDRQYVVAPGSIHPTTGKPYEVVSNAEIIPAPEWLIAWLISQKVSNTTGQDGGWKPVSLYEPVTEGGRNTTLTSRAGAMHHIGLSEESILRELMDINEKCCQPPLPDSEVETIAHSIGSKPPDEVHEIITGPRTRVIENQVQGPPPVLTASESSYRPQEVGVDMSDAVLDGRLGEICQRRLTANGLFPIAYAWPALVAAAGAMVPVMQMPPHIIADDQMTNFFTGLVGPVHSGKSQAIKWAYQAIGLPPHIYTAVRAGSSEGLVLKLSIMQKKSQIGDSAFIDLDEWKHLFDKAGIQGSSFATFLQTAFYKRHQNIVGAGGRQFEFDCAVTLIGGIVTDDFEECFGANSMGGLHDRFTFGLCPDGYDFQYRPFEGKAEDVIPNKVLIDPDVYEMIAALRKADRRIGREAEIAVRFAHVAAAFDGRQVLHAKDCEVAVAAVIAEQVRIREMLQPNEGVTNDAVCANALMRLLQRAGPNQEIVSARAVRHGLRRLLTRLGPGALEYATRTLLQQGLIWRGDLPGKGQYKGRVPQGYALVQEV